MSRKASLRVWAFGVVLCVAALAAGPSVEAAPPLTRTAVYRTTTAPSRGVAVQPVRHYRHYGYGGYYRPYGYGGGFYRPYPVYAAPVIVPPPIYRAPVYPYANYGYPAYGYPGYPAYGYPAYGYGVGVGVW